MAQVMLTVYDVNVGMQAAMLEHNRLSMDTCVFLSGKTLAV